LTRQQQQQQDHAGRGPGGCVGQACGCQQRVPCCSSGLRGASCPLLMSVRMHVRGAAARARERSGAHARHVAYRRVGQNSGAHVNEHAQAAHTNECCKRSLDWCGRNRHVSGEEPSPCHQSPECAFGGRGRRRSQRGRPSPAAAKNKIPRNNVGARQGRQASRAGEPLLVHSALTAGPADPTPLVVSGWGPPRTMCRRHPTQGRKVWLVYPTQT